MKTFIQIAPNRLGNILGYHNYGIPCLDSLSVKRPTTLANVERLPVIGLVMRITVPIGAVRCNTKVLY
jgi:hypothetical protein